MVAWYCGSTKWTAVTAWAAATAYIVGDLRRQLATPTVGNERVFRCTTAGTSGGAEPAWTLTKGATTNDNTAVWTEVTGNSTYGWTAAHARVANTLSWMAAGDDCYVSNNHAEAQTSVITWPSPGTAANPCQLLCCVDTATPPTTRATTGTATQNTQGGWVCSGFANVDGITLICSAALSSPTVTFGAVASWWWRLENCSIQLPGSNANQRIFVGVNSTSQASGLLELVNTTVKFGVTNGGFVVHQNLRWSNTPSAVNVSVATPSTLFQTAAGNHGLVECVGVDFSALTSKNLVDVSTGDSSIYRFIDCKLAASIVLGSGSHIGQGGIALDVINCDSADTNYRLYRQRYQGLETQETTIVRSGGASDGTTSVSRKVVTTANPKIYSPYESLPIEFWQNSVGAAITISIPVITDGVTLTDAEAWLEVEYLGTSGFPLGNFGSDRVSDPVFGTPANQATDATSTWTTTGLSSPVKQTLDVTFTPVKAGLVRCRVMVAKASTTLYYDPKALVASGRQYMSEAGHVNEGVAGGILVNPGLSGGLL